MLPLLTNGGYNFSYNYTTKAIKIPSLAHGYAHVTSSLPPVLSIIGVNVIPMFSECV